MRKLLPLLLLTGCAPSVDMTRFDPTPRPPVPEAEVRFTDEDPTLAMIIVAGFAGIPVNSTRFTAVALSCP